MKVDWFINSFLSLSLFIFPDLFYLLFLPLNNVLACLLSCSSFSLRLSLALRVAGYLLTYASLMHLSFPPCVRFLPYIRIIVSADRLYKDAQNVFCKNYTLLPV